MSLLKIDLNSLTQKACLFAATFLSQTMFATQVVEHLDRMEINWSTQKIRFYGESGPKENLLKGVDGAEKRAWADGLAAIAGSVHDYGVSVFEDLSTNTEKVSGDAREASINVTKSVYSYNTLFFGDGTVRVFLESSLPKALTTSLIRFRQKESAPAHLMQKTGVVLRLNTSTRARPRYKVLDEAGVPLFEAGDMAEDGFNKNLMGRWFESPADSESAEFIGKNPIVVDASVDTKGNFVIPRATWESGIEGHKALLVNGLIAIILPSKRNPR